MQLPYLIRSAGHRVLGGLPVRIRSGPNRDLRWSAAALGRGYGSGSFARDRLAALAAVVRPGDCFWDVGAHKGFVSLAAARMVGPRGYVVAIEPSATNLRFLRRHLRWNRVENVRVLPVALSDAPGEAPFGGRGSSVAFRLGEGPEAVSVHTVDGLVNDLRVLAPTVLKVDVEGEEAAVLRGAGDLLAGDQALLVSTHSRVLYEECRAILLDRSFRVFDSREITAHHAAGTEWSSDHDLLAIGPAREVNGGAISRLRLVGGPSIARASPGPKK
jgi:FkbM family methyltransferase